MRCQFEAEKKRMEQQHRAELEKNKRDLTAQFSRLMPPQQSSPGEQKVMREHFRQELRHDHSHCYDQSSPQFRRSPNSPGSSSLSEEEVRMKRSKAFRQVLDIKNPEYFDGTNMMRYLPWKIALQKGVPLGDRPNSMAGINQDQDKVRRPGSCRQSLRSIARNIARKNIDSSMEVPRQTV